MNTKLIPAIFTGIVSGIVSLLLITFSLTSCSEKDDDTATDEDIMFEEDFADNTLQWPEGNFSYADFKIEDGKYIIQSKQNLSDSLFCIYLNHTFFGSQHNIRFTLAQMEGENTLTYGIKWFRKDNYNFYNFLLFNNLYTITYMVNGDSHLICDWTASGFIQPVGNYNTIEIKCRDNRMYFYINDNLVHEYQSEIVDGQKIGIQAQGLGKFAIDHIKVYR